MNEPLPQNTSTSWRLAPLRRALRRRALLIAVCLLAGIGAAAAVSQTQDTEYTATAGLLFRDTDYGELVFGASQTGTFDTDRIATTNLGLLKQDVVAARAAEKLGLKRGDVKSMVGFSTQPKSDIVSISARASTPVSAQRLANSYALAFIELRRAADKKALQDARQTVVESLARLPAEQRGTAVGQNLQKRSDELSVLESLQTGKAELVQPAEAPDSPSAPRTTRNVAVGALFGLLVGLLAAAVAERLDRRIRNATEVEQDFGAPVLGLVPKMRRLNLTRPSGAELDPFLMLRTNLSYYNVDAPVRSLMVTSSMAGDGKSTVAWYAAVAAAHTGSRVVLLDADLRAPSLADRLQLAPIPGLSDWLSGRASMSEVIRTVDVGGNSNGADKPRSVDVVLSGGLPPNPTELVNSEAMRHVLDALSRDYDVVVVDTPPLTLVPDAIPLVAQVDGVLVVAGLGRTTHDAAAALRSQLRHLDARVLGVVANRVDPGDDAYGYGYGYGRTDVIGGVSGPERLSSANQV